MENTGTLRIVRVRTFLIVTKKPIFHKIKYSLIHLDYKFQILNVVSLLFGLYLIIYHIIQNNI
jgi:hypothetical protein